MEQERSEEELNILQTHVYPHCGRDAGIKHIERLGTVYISLLFQVVNIKLT